MKSKKTPFLLDQLAFAHSTGVKITDWAESHGVTARTAYAWLKDPEVVALETGHRRETVARVLSRYQELAEAAVGVIGQLMRAAEDEAVKLRAARAVISDLISLTGLTDIDKRISELEERLPAPGGRQN